MLSAAIGATEIDSIVAVVNNKAITYSQLDAQVQLTKAQLRWRDEVPPDDSLLRQKVLQEMIDDELQLQLADDNGITVSDTLIRSNVERYQQNLGMSESEFDRYIKALYGDIDSFYDELHDQMRIDFLLHGLIYDAIQIEDDEIDEFLRDEKQSTREYLVAHIFINVPSDSNAQSHRESLNKMRDIRTKASSTLSSFNQLAIEFSDADSALEGGRINWTAWHRFPREFVEALDKIEEGSITEIIELDNGFHLLLLQGKRDALSKKSSRARVKSIVRQGEDAFDILTRLIERARNGEDFGQLSHDYSQVDEVADAYGDVGWLNVEGLPGELQLVINNLEEGQVSDPIYSSDYWHVFRLEERRDENVANVRDDARALLRNQKIFVEREKWLTRLREDSYIRVLLQ